MQKYDFLFPILGLANRMRAIDSAVSLSRDKQQEVKVFWQKDFFKNCLFTDLFEPKPASRSRFAMAESINPECPATYIFELSFIGLVSLFVQGNRGLLPAKHLPPGYFQIMERHIFDQPFQIALGLPARATVGFWGIAQKSVLPWGENTRGQNPDNDIVSRSDPIVELPWIRRTYPFFKNCFVHADYSRQFDQAFSRKFDLDSRLFESHSGKLPHGARHAGSDYIVFREVLLQNELHSPYVIGSVSPVSLCIEISQETSHAPVKAMDVTAWVILRVTNVSPWSGLSRVTEHIEDYLIDEVKRKYGIPLTFENMDADNRPLRWCR